MNQKILIYFLFIFSLIIPLSVLATDGPGFPMAFYGTAEINSQDAPVGTIIRAYNSSGVRIDQEIDLITTTAGLYGTDNISNPTPADNRLLVVGSGTVYFRAIISGYNNGQEIIAPQTKTFSSDTVARQDLTFIATADDPEVCSPASVTHGTVAAYPACTITCDSDYILSGNNTCVLEGVCSPASVAHGTVAAYPACTITCNADYTLSNSACVPVDTDDDDDAPTTPTTPEI